VNEPKIPVFLAVGFWSASALAVLSYTYIALRETANGGLENFAVQGGIVPTEVAVGGVLSAELTPQPAKPLNRNKFTPSH
jgi:hypothetical protein